MSNAVMEERTQPTPGPVPDENPNAAGKPVKATLAKKGVKLAKLEKQNATAPSGKKAEKSRVGSARGIESMFRNSYRAQLDMIALAATKANIMISLNGVLLSVLLVSGVYFLGSQPMLIVPFATFMLTCSVAIVFAVLAARPVKQGKPKTLEDFRTDRGDLLIFEQFAKLPKQQYVDAMMEMIGDNERVYRNMIVHIHDMGRTADRKFANLYVSYSTFMVGMVTSVLLLLVVKARHIVMGG